MGCIAFFSDTTLKGRGLLSVQDAQGSIKRSVLEEGFLDFLKKVLVKLLLVATLPVHGNIS